MYCGHHLLWNKRACVLPKKLQKSEVAVFLVYRRITFASCLLEAFPVLDGHVASGIGDKPRFVKDACCDGD
jgi:hypothetical protein